MVSEQLEVGRAYTETELMEMFNIANSGGIRYSIKNNVLVLTQVIHNSPYPDSINWEENTIDYVGAGQHGDQKIERGNKRISNAKLDNTPIYFFIKDKENHNIYFGEAELLNTIDDRHGLDEDEVDRKLIVFRLKLNALNKYKDKLNSIYNCVFNIKQSNDENMANKSSTKKLLKNVKKHEINVINNGVNVIKIPSTTIKYERDQSLVKLAKDLSNGICQLCGSKAPFNDKNGNPFLEVHHIDWLSNGGKDSIYNVIAICPNCHRKMHQLQDPMDVKKLKIKAKHFAELNGF